MISGSLLHFENISRETSRTLHYTGYICAHADASSRISYSDVIARRLREYEKHNDRISENISTVHETPYAEVTTRSKIRVTVICANTRSRTSQRTANFALRSKFILRSPRTVKRIKFHNRSRVSPQDPRLNKLIPPLAYTVRMIRASRISDLLFRIIKYF